MRPPSGFNSEVKDFYQFTWDDVRVDICDRAADHKHPGGGIRRGKNEGKQETGKEENSDEYDRQWITTGPLVPANNLLVRIPSDMKFFRQETTGKVIVMGRKTLEKPAASH